MRLHYLQHVPFEGPGIIEEWAKARGAVISVSQLFNNDPLPDPEHFDWLVVMGGPMGIYDHDEHPWLVAEKQFIRQAVNADKTVLGICLGAQLIADVLGAEVYPGPQKEIGWFPVRREAGAPDLLPEELTVFHWHGDTFDLPAGAIPLASSTTCRNQGFIYNDRVVALQFHMETTPESMEALIENCGDELVDVPGIQTGKQMRAGLSNIGTINTAMYALLDQLNAAPQCLQ
jgi:GMP synthase (glutamine-hydrolysing)